MDKVEYTPEEEENLYKQNFWYDGVSWKKLAICYRTTHESLLKLRYQKLLNAFMLDCEEGRMEVTSLNRMNFVAYEDESRKAFKEFIRTKTAYSDYHERGWKYIINHSLAKFLVFSVRKYDKLEDVALRISIEYPSFIVSQVCIPYIVKKFYALELGHKINMALPYYYLKPVLLGDNPAYDYTKKIKL